jgi:hypothetical protein
MSRGIPSLNTSPKSEPGGAPFNPNAAENGLSVDSVSGKIVLGNDSGDPLQPALLSSDREIPMGARALYLRSTIDNAEFAFNGNQASLIGDTFSFFGVNNRASFQQSTLFSFPTMSGVQIGTFYLYRYASSAVVLSENIAADDLGLGNMLVEYNVLVRGSLQRLRAVDARSAGPVAVATNFDTDKVFTNEGATGPVTFVLPTANVGATFTFYVQDANGVVIQAPPSQTVRVGTLVTAPGGSVSSVTVGSSVTLVVINTSEWVAIAFVGTWI